MKFSEAINQAIKDSMEKYKNMLILGQGVWSPFYVGQTMDEIERIFGRTRVIDTPVSENAITGIALGAAIAGNPTLVIHPRMDFMVLAMDPLVNGAAKWRYALDWQGPIPLTIRAIINRGGEQGAQHSQSLQSWFSHVPGLRVVMPSTPSDAYLLLRSCIDSPDPCIFIEDRWNYEDIEEFDTGIDIPNIKSLGSKIVRSGEHATLVSYGYTVNKSLEIANILSGKGISLEVIDLRIMNPINLQLIYRSVGKTGQLIVVEEAWSPSSVGSEIMSKVFENVPLTGQRTPAKYNLPFTPAPTSKSLEEQYFLSVEKIASEISRIIDVK